MSGKQQLCATHNKMRNARFLVQDAAGAWQCTESGPCIAPAPAPRGDDGQAEELVDLCDLCNGDIRGGQNIDDHLMKYHATLVMRCNELVEEGAALRESHTPLQAVLAALGSAVRGVAEKSDKGPKAYEVTVEAARQLSLILRHAFPTAEVFTFGSCVACGSWDGAGDVDFTLVDPAGWERNLWPPQDEGRVVLDIAKALRSAGFAYDTIEPLCRTRVPIVKRQRPDPPELWRVHDPKARTLFYRFQQKLSAADLQQMEQQLNARLHPVKKDPRGVLAEFRTGEAALSALMLRNDIMLAAPVRYDKRWANAKLRPAIFEVDFDISCRAHGIRNSILLRKYLQQSHIIRAGGVYIKTWSKRSGVNNSKRGYLTSYAVNILWIYYLVQTGLATHVDPETVPFRPDPAIAAQSTTYLDMVPRSKADPNFEQRLGEAVTGFFRFYALQFDWKTNVVSINRPTVTSREWMKWTEDKQVHAKIFRDRVWYHCCIEDPYEDNLNLGRHVSSIKKHKVVTEFIQALSSILCGAIPRVLDNRSSEAATTRCLSALHRSMVGRMECRLGELVAALRRVDVNALAAFEVEQRTTKLIELGGYTLSNDQDPWVRIAPAAIGSLYVPPEAQALIDETDSQLKAQRGGGVCLTAKMKVLNLQNIFYFDPAFDRCFWKEDDAQQLRAHARAVQSAIEDLEQDGIEWGKEHLQGHVMDRVTVPFSQEAFDCAVDVSLQKKRAAPVAPAQGGGGGGSTSLKRSTKPPSEAPCDECGRRGLVWKTSDISLDGGRYCDACWKKLGA